jgi:hypothetical protein
MRALRIAIPTVLFLVVAGPLAAQSAPAPKAEAPKEDLYVIEKGFASRVFDVKHRDPVDLMQVLRPLGSGYRGATMNGSREFNTITVRDFPENIATIEAALKRLDVFEAARPDVELRLWVLVAGNGEGSGVKLSEDLKEVVATLKSTLTYRSYVLAGTFVQRVRDGARGIHGEGVTDLWEAAGGKSAKSMQLEYHISSLNLEPAASGPASLRLDGFALTLSGLGRAQVKTDVTLRDGEKVVVGTSTVQDHGLVVVVSARVLR